MTELYEPTSDFLRFILAAEIPLSGSEMGEANLRRLVAITRDRLPYLGRLAPNILFALGYSGHGVILAGLAGTLLGEAVSGTLERFDRLARLRHQPFPGGPLKPPILVAAMLYYRLRDML